MRRALITGFKGFVGLHLTTRVGARASRSSGWTGRATRPWTSPSPYSATEIGAHKLTESFHRLLDLPVATLRPFTIRALADVERNTIVSGRLLET